jgi:hypothetical protein
MLVVALAIALPRTWIHDCTDVPGEHLIHNMDGDHAQITHENCPICDYAPASPLAPVLLVALSAPVAEMAIETPVHQAFASPQVRLTAQRGPPTA